MIFSLVHPTDPETSSGWRSWFCFSWLSLGVNSFLSSSDRSRNEFGMTTLDLFCKFIAWILFSKNFEQLKFIKKNSNFYQKTTPPRTPPPHPYRHAELVSASVGKAYDEKLRSFCFKNNDFFSSSSDRSRNKFGMTFLVLFFLIVTRGWFLP